MSTTSSTSVAPFSTAQLAALDALMDLLIPASADGRMPAARSLELFRDLAALRPVDRSLLEDGLADLEARAMRAHGQGFAQLGMPAAQALVQVLRDERSAFLQAFVTQTVGRYMAHPRVLPLIGLEPRPLWPKGNVVAEGDWSLLQVVKQRPKNYRKV